jgi:hypothetical protein
MFLARTQADALRRGMYFRVFNVALLLFMFASAIFSGGAVFAIFAGSLAVLQVATLAFYFWMFRHADPAFLAAPLDPAIRMHWHYLRPNKYPYQAPVTPPVVPDNGAQTVQSPHCRDRPQAGRSPGAFSGAQESAIEARFRPGGAPVSGTADRQRTLVDKRDPGERIRQRSDNQPVTFSRFRRLSPFV